MRSFFVHILFGIVWVFFVVGSAYLIVRSVDPPTYEDFDIRRDLGETQPKYYGHPLDKRKALPYGGE